MHLSFQAFVTAIYALLLAGILAASPSAAAAAPTANLLDNPGFENGTAPWALFIPEGEKKETITYAITATGPRGGRNCAALKSADFARYGLATKRQPVSPGERYRFTGWVNSQALQISADSPGIIFRISFQKAGETIPSGNLYLDLDGTLASIGSLPVKRRPPTTWKKTEAVFDIPADVDTLQIVAFSWVTKGTLLLDDLALEKIDPGTPAVTFTPPAPDVPAPDIRPTAAEIAQIAAWLEPAPRAFMPPASDRAAWRAISLHPDPVRGALVRQDILEHARRERDRPLPQLTDELYHHYDRTGQRPPYEEPYARRLNRAAILALAESIDYKGDNLSLLRETLDAILSEPTWVLPWHGGGRDQPANRDYVDLAAAMRAGTLATIYQWLGEELGPEMRTRIRSEIDRRVVAPYLARVYGDKSLVEGGGFWWLTNHYNWNPVCHAGVVYAALATEPHRDIRARVIAAARKNIAHYLDGFSADGYCAEGMGYWDYGVGNFVVLAETLSRATDGHVDLYLDPRIPLIARYPPDFELYPSLYPAFADSSPGVQPLLWTRELFARRGILPSVKNAGKIATGNQGQGRMLYQTDLTLNPPAAASVAPAVASVPTPSHSALRGYFPDAQVLVARLADPAAGLAVAIKGGVNGRSHGHLDLGSYVVANQGALVLVDPGSEVYTQRTFGAHRFDSAVLNSHGHPVPEIDGKRQSAHGSARILETNFTDDADTFVLDLTQAYEIPGLSRVQRTLTYDRANAGTVTIADDIALDHAVEIETALITFGTMTRLDERRLLIQERGIGVIAMIDAGGVPFDIVEERIDETLVAKRQATRIGIRTTRPVKAVVFSVTVNSVPGTRKTSVLPANRSLLENAGALRIEAETFETETGGAAIKQPRLDASGESLDLGPSNGAPHVLSWQIDCPQSGDYHLALRYANDVGGSSATLRLASQPACEIYLPPTGGWAGTWGNDLDRWSTVLLARDDVSKPRIFTLSAGLHTLNFEHLGPEQHLDWLELIPVNPSALGK